MDVQQLNKALCTLLDKKIILNGLSYDDERYDHVEEEIHDLEDELNEKYGQYLEEKLYEVHDEYCPDSDILLPTAYIPNKVIKSDDAYHADFNQGVYVDADDFQEDSTKLVLLPNPLRLVLQVNPQKQEVLWSV